MTGQQYDGPLQGASGPPSAGEGRRAGAPAGDTCPVEPLRISSPAEPPLYWPPSGWTFAAELRIELMGGRPNYPPESWMPNGIVRREWLADGTLSPDLQDWEIELEIAARQP